MKLIALTMASAVMMSLGAAGVFAQDSDAGASPDVPAMPTTPEGAPVATDAAATGDSAAGDSAPDENAAPDESATDDAAAGNAAANAASAEVDAPTAGFVPDTKAVSFEDGRWLNAEGIPTFKIEGDTVDYPTYAGYLRYNSMCHVCHGPDGEGSTFAPAIKNSVARKLDYYQFQQIVASGLQDVSESSTLVMPAFGTDRNVWCYIDDIYVYLLARGTDSLGRGRPAAHEPKSPEFAAIEDSCMS